MGKRGPKPKGEYADKSVVLSTNITVELRGRLREEADKSGLTISREVELRLRKSFESDDKISEGFGSRRNRAFMKMIAMMMQTVHRADRVEADWLDDPWLFDQFKMRLDALFELYRPSGAGTMPDAQFGNGLDTPAVHKYVAGQDAARLVDAVQQADSSIPIRAPAKAGLLNRLKSDLGGAADRSQLSKQSLPEVSVPAKAPRKARAAKKGAS